MQIQTTVSFPQDNLHVELEKRRPQTLLPISCLSQVKFSIETLLHHRYIFLGSLGESEPILSYILTFPIESDIFLTFLV